MSNGEHPLDTEFPAARGLLGGALQHVQTETTVALSQAAIALSGGQGDIYDRLREDDPEAVAGDLLEGVEEMYGQPDMSRAVVLAVLTEACEQARERIEESDTAHER